MICSKCKSENVRIENNRFGETGKLHKVKFCYDCGHKIRLKKELAEK
jgi:ribosomal protein L33